jgi:hypothetical protein
VTERLETRHDFESESKVAGGVAQRIAQQRSGPLRHAVQTGVQQARARSQHVHRSVV